MYLQFFVSDFTQDIPLPPSKLVGPHGYGTHTKNQFSFHFKDKPTSSNTSKFCSENNIQIPTKADCPYDESLQRFICPICNHKYITYSSLCNHMKFKHMGLYEVYCEICGKGFQRRVHLEGHMAMHGKPMNFECVVCGTKYAHKTSLRAHEKLAHGIIS